MSRIILWLRNDLRMHDNNVFNWAINYKSANKEIVPLYCFDPRYYLKEHSQTMYATRKTGLIRARFQIETVENLRKNLRNIGSDLLVSYERPEDFIPKLIVEKSNTENIIVYQSEITSEELIIESQVRKNVEILLKNNNEEKYSAKMQPVQGLTLYHLNDLEYDPNEFLPPNCTKFRESNLKVQVRSLRPTPTKNQMCLPQNKSELIEQSRNFIPKLLDFGYEKVEIEQDRDKRACYNFIGGEDKGLERLNEYIMGKKSIVHYADTRNNLIGSEYSSKLSPWLANGSVSIRQVYFATKEFEEINQQSQSTKKFIDELIWRDFCKYWFMRYKNKGFSQYGVQDKVQFNWRIDKNIIQRWQKGQTGMPLVDSLMREMNATGFMGNRGRQIVASYLTLDLKQDWRYGAHYFEEMLIDHDVTSNYGSWNFSAGIGPGKVLNFNSIKQSRDFDKDGKFIRMWCPELRNVPNDYIHDPWNMPIALQKSTGVFLDQHYPKPIVCQKYTGQDIAKQQYRYNDKMNVNDKQSNI